MEKRKTKAELIREIEGKTKKAKPVALNHFRRFLREKKRTKADLERISKTTRVSRDGLDIAFKY